MSTPVFVSASERNKRPILERLREFLPRQASVLEVGAGWGQHASFFTASEPGWTWLPSEHPEVVGALRDQLAGLDNESMREPLGLDVSGDEWPDEKFDVVYSANTAHIMSWRQVQAMFAGIETVLAEGGIFCLYGPFNEDGQFTADSNEEFDRGLRSRDPLMGLRDLAELESLAVRHQLELEARISMPANNFLLVFRAGLQKAGEVL